MNNAPIIACDNLCKSFGNGNSAQTVLSGVNLAVHRGDTLSIAGSSGSGKTTLLHLLGGLDFASSGTVHADGKNWNEMPSNTAAKWRNQKLGFIFQLHLLLPEFSAAENAAMPLLIRHLPKQQALETAHQILAQLGLAAHAAKTPDKLSGGERQRVSVARALVGKPACILADEPTGNLDGKNAAAVFDLMMEAAAAQNTAVIVVSHDVQLAAKTARHAVLIDGKLEEH